MRTKGPVQALAILAVVLGGTTLLPACGAATRTLTEAPLAIEPPDSALAVSGDGARVFAVGDGQHICAVVPLRVETGAAPTATTKGKGDKTAPTLPPTPTEPTPPIERYRVVTVDAGGAIVANGQIPCAANLFGGIGRLVCAGERGVTLFDVTTLQQIASWQPKGALLSNVGRVGESLAVVIAGEQLVRVDRGGKASAPVALAGARFLGGGEGLVIVGRGVGVTKDRGGRPEIAALGMDGKQVWRVPLGSDRAAVAFAGSTLLAAPGGEVMTAYDAATGAPQWMDFRVMLPDGVPSAAGILTRGLRDDGVPFVGVVDAATRTLRWWRRWPNGSLPSRLGTGAGVVLYSDAGRWIARDVHTGDRLGAGGEAEGAIVDMDVVGAEGRDRDRNRDRDRGVAVWLGEDAEGLALHASRLGAPGEAAKAETVARGAGALMPRSPAVAPWWLDGVTLVHAAVHFAGREPRTGFLLDAATEPLVVRVERAPRPGGGDDAKDKDAADKDADAKGPLVQGGPLAWRYTIGDRPSGSAQIVAAGREGRGVLSVPWQAPQADEAALMLPGPTAKTLFSVDGDGGRDRDGVRVRVRVRDRVRDRGRDRGRDGSPVLSLVVRDRSPALPGRSPPVAEHTLSLRMTGRSLHRARFAFGDSERALHVPVRVLEDKAQRARLLVADYPGSPLILRAELPGLQWHLVRVELPTASRGAAASKGADAAPKPPAPPKPPKPPKPPER